MRPSTFIGQVTRKNSLWKAVRVSVQKMKMDRYLTMYFDKRQYYWVSDPKDQCTEGDLVLIKLLPEQQTDLVKHYIKEIVFKVGHTVDPVTGRRCRGWNFVDETNRTFDTLMPESHDLEASAAESPSGSTSAS